MRNREEVIAEIPKNSRECFRVSRSVFNGHVGVNFRIWFREGDEGEWMPTKRGVWIGKEYVPEVTEALIRAVETDAEKEERAA